MQDLQVTDHQIIEAMTTRSAGSFAQALGRAATHADPANLAKIKAAFPEMWEAYAHAAAFLAIVESRCELYQSIQEAASDRQDAALARSH